MIRTYFFGWFGLLLIAMGNGFLREVYLPSVGVLTAHQISVCTGIAFFALFMWFLESRRPLSSSRDAWAIGGLWLLMTVCFEFLFFHYARGVPWDVLLHDYNIVEGRLWILVLLWVAIGPFAVWRVMKK